jgi:DNA polymerase-3 subunit chi
LGEAFFYQLMGQPPEAVLPRLLDLATERGWPVELRGPSRDRMEALDLALWGPSTEFRPHGLAGGAHDADQPILLTWGTGVARPCLCLIDGAGVRTDEARAAERVMIVFDGADEAMLATARGQWRDFTGAGLPARFYVREGASWALKAERPGAGRPEAGRLEAGRPPS